MTADTSRPGPRAEEARPEGYPEPVAAFVERFAADLTEAGMQRMAARVFACLLAADEGALSSTELAARLRVSPAAVSGAVRYLAQVHLVSREREPGSRRERYRLHDNAWYAAMLRRDTMIGRWADTMTSGIAAVGESTRAGRRMAETAEFLLFLRTELDALMERWRSRRAEPSGAPPDGA
ncbi:GbsR/MarR family transcriptional regulator [Streptomyces boetiae]|uniref:GbsR/MarR family transcriptional regulator n=1 Tax=Streptomyces boetiae TaxID=3075541 RepID=UPI00374E1DDB